MFGN
jgi:hypothetical protein